MIQIEPSLTLAKDVAELNCHPVTLTVEFLNLTHIF